MPAACPHDGAAAIRIFSPPLDLLMYNREPAAPSGRATIPPGALSCHDHGAPADAHDAASGSHDAEAGSRWHARGYDAEPAGEPTGAPHSHPHSHPHGRAHGHGHTHR